MVKSLLVHLLRGGYILGIWKTMLSCKLTQILSQQFNLYILCISITFSEIIVEIILGEFKGRIQHYDYGLPIFRMLENIVLPFGMVVYFQVSGNNQSLHLINVVLQLSFTVKLILIFLEYLEMVVIFMENSDLHRYNPF